MFKLLENICNEQTATVDDLVLFKSIIIYVGKGCRLRKSSHLADSFKVLTGSMKDGKLNKRLKKILDIWGNVEESEFLNYAEILTTLFPCVDKML